MNPIQNSLVFLRGGGLGDFLLTIPVLFEACNRYESVHLFTRPSYRSILLNHELDNLEFHDLDGEIIQAFKLCSGNDVISFWNDPEWIQDLKNTGLSKLSILVPRPKNGPHVVQRFFEDLGWDFTDDLLRIAWLGDQWKKRSKNLWIHPGSGSFSKNASITYFEERAHQWIRKNSENQVTLSFGECDEELREKFRNASLVREKKVELLTDLSLSDFKDRMANQAGAYLGNDSGPSHLAAMLGIPTEVIYLSTSPRIWSPVGPRVKLLGIQ